MNTITVNCKNNSYYYKTINLNKTSLINVNFFIRQGQILNYEILYFPNQKQF